MYAKCYKPDVLWRHLYAVSIQMTPKHSYSYW